jgi:hypothetical protein
VLREKFLSGGAIVLLGLGKGRSASLKRCPCVIEGGNQNLYFLGEKDPVGIFIKPCIADCLNTSLRPPQKEPNHKNRRSCVLHPTQFAQFFL